MPTFQDFSELRAVSELFKQPKKEVNADDYLKSLSKDTLTLKIL